jgi:hypothetical protein
VRIAAIYLDHPEVEAIQPTWHCLLRFRQRLPGPPGTEEALAGLRSVLEDADIARIPPGWAAGQQAERWATGADVAFPLARSGRPGVWTALTCLSRERAR